MAFLEKLIQRASSLNRTVALGEGSDKRVLMASKILTERKAARIVVLGQTDQVAADLKEIGAPMDAIRIIDPKTAEKRHQ